MLILKILIVLAVLFVVTLGVTGFNEHCRVRFGHAFFTVSAFWKTFAAIVLIISGFSWRASAVAHHGDTLNGMLLMLAGVGIAAWVVFVNFKQTNVVYGIGGSLLQLAAFSFVTWIGIPLLLAVLFVQLLLIILTGSAQRVYVINRNR